MASITKEQRDYLWHHKIPLSQVFDATGMTPAEYKKAMHAQEMFVAVGVRPCKAGHTLKTPSGNCIQCRSDYIEYKRRHDGPAYVYISASRSEKLIKVGSSKSPDEREKLLNARGYGGVSDWSKIGQVQCKHAGRVEFEVHEILAAFASPRSYLREGIAVDCTEIFSCGYLHARKALLDVLSEDEAKTLKERKDASINYNFPERDGEKFNRGRKDK